MIPNGDSTAKGDFINYPLSPTLLTTSPLAAGWSLITYQGTGPGDPSQLGAVSATASPVTMIISADDTQATQTWIKGATSRQTLTALQPGAADFVFLPTESTAFTFNLGAAALAGSTLLVDVNARKFDQVPDQIKLWTHANHKVMPGLVARRAAEAALWEA